jgi:hypothetical protein
MSQEVESAPGEAWWPWFGARRDPDGWTIACPAGRGGDLCRGRVPLEFLWGHWGLLMGLGCRRGCSYHVAARAIRERCRLLYGPWEEASLDTSFPAVTQLMSIAAARELAERDLVEPLLHALAAQNVFATAAVAHLEPR